MENLLDTSYNFSDKDLGIIVLDWNYKPTERFITTFTGYFKFSDKNSVFMRFDKKMVHHCKIFYDLNGNVEKIIREYDKLWFFDIYKYYFHSKRVIHFLKGEEDTFCPIEKSKSICVLEPHVCSGSAKDRWACTSEYVNLIINRNEDEVTLYTKSIHDLDIRPFTKLYMEKILGLI